LRISGDYSQGLIEDDEKTIELEWKEDNLNEIENTIIKILEK